MKVKVSVYSGFFSKKPKEEYVVSTREELRKENVELLNKVKYLENKKSYYCNRFVNEMKENLKNKDKMKKHSLMFKVLYSIIVILGAINVWNLF